MDFNQKYSSRILTDTFYVTFLLLHLTSDVILDLLYYFCVFWSIHLMYFGSFLLFSQKNNEKVLSFIVVFVYFYIHIQLSMSSSLKNTYYSSDVFNAPVSCSDIIFIIICLLYVRCMIIAHFAPIASPAIIASVTALWVSMVSFISFL